MRRARGLLGLIVAIEALVLLHWLYGWRYWVGLGLEELGLIVAFAEFCAWLRMRRRITQMLAQAFAPGGTLQPFFASGPFGHVAVSRTAAQISFSARKLALRDIGVLMGDAAPVKRPVPVPLIGGQIGPVVGYRSWEPVYMAESSSDRQGWLGSRFRRELWPPGGIVASCGNGLFRLDKEDLHAAPEQTCSCGIYAFNNPSGLGYDRRIEGAILGWGKVVQHEWGFRAERARILALLRPGEHETVAPQTHPNDTPRMLVELGAFELEHTGEDCAPEITLQNLGGDSKEWLQSCCSTCGAARVIEMPEWLQPRSALEWVKEAGRLYGVPVVDREQLAAMVGEWA